jgi:hypothetical protein
MAAGQSVKAVSLTQKPWVSLHLNPKKSLPQNGDYSPISSMCTRMLLIGKRDLLHDYLLTMNYLANNIKF